MGSRLAIVLCRRNNRQPFKGIGNAYDIAKFSVECEAGTELLISQRRILLRKCNPAQVAQGHGLKVVDVQ